MDIIDLKKEEYFIQQYIDLRNKYTDILLTSNVNIFETKTWIKKGKVEIRGLVQDNILVGVVILYLDREGEIAFFVKHPNKGTGSKLLKIIEDVAKHKKLTLIWGLVLKDNIRAQKAFEKNGFIRDGISRKKYKGKVRYGIVYKKYLDP